MESAAYTTCRDETRREPAITCLYNFVTCSVLKDVPSLFVLVTVEGPQWKRLSFLPFGNLTGTNEMMMGTKVYLLQTQSAQRRNAMILQCDLDFSVPQLYSHSDLATSEFSVCPRLAEARQYPGTEKCWKSLWGFILGVIFQAGVKNSTIGLNGKFVRWRQKRSRVTQCENCFTRSVVELSRCAHETTEATCCGNGCLVFRTNCAPAVALSRTWRTHATSGWNYGSAPWGKDRPSNVIKKWKTFAPCWPSCLARSQMVQAPRAVWLRPWRDSPLCL